MIAQLVELHESNCRRLSRCSPLIFASKRRIIAAPVRPKFWVISYPNANIIAMYAEGKMKLPINDVERLAKVLDIDPDHFLVVVLRDYMPDTLAVIERIIGSPLLTHNERKLIDSYRRVTQGKQPPAVMLDIKEVIALVVV